MKRFGYVAIAALFFSSTPFVYRLGSFPAALATVIFGALLAVLASGSVDALAIGLGASAAFAGTVLGTVSAPLGTAVLMALVFGERTLRVRDFRSRLVHVGLALGSGAAAAMVAQAYRGAPLPTLGVAGLVAAVLVAAPFLVEADDPVAHALSLAAKDCRGATADAFARGAELRRAVPDVPLDRTTAREVEDTWRALLGLAAARQRLDRGSHIESKAAAGVLAKLDARILEHVDVLARAYTAVDAASAAVLVTAPGAVARVAEDQALRDEESEALAEIEAELDSAKANVVRS